MTSLRTNNPNKENNGDERTTRQYYNYNPLKDLSQAQEAMEQLQAVFSTSTNNNKNNNNQDNETATASVRFYSMRAAYDQDLLTLFYEQLMVTNFPLERERDDLEDWIKCLDPAAQIKKINNEDDDDDDDDDEIVDMDVIILVVGGGDDNHDGNKQNPGVIVAGIALEYYKPSQVGLISYLCVAPSHRRRGLIRILHPLAIACLQQLHVVHTTTTAPTHSTTTTTATTKIRAILAETNTLTAGDASPELIAQRHYVLHRLGYRQLMVPYVQPPLAVGEESFDDILLLVYTNGTDDDNTDKQHRNDEIDESFIPLSVDSKIILDYVTDFYQSVYGRDQSHEYHLHWYYRVLSWYCHTHAQIPLAAVAADDDDASPTPWTLDCTEHCHRELEQSMQNIGIVGAGIAALVTAVTLAQQQLLLLRQQGEQRQNEFQPCTIVLWEAHDYVGGRIRTILTDNNNDNQRQRQGHHDRYLPNLQQTSLTLELQKQYQAFAPWPISIGAEFVHGVRGTLSELIAQQNWDMEETFDLSTAPDHHHHDKNKDKNQPEHGDHSNTIDESDNGDALLSRSQTKRLSQLQRDYGHIRVFDGGHLWRFDKDDDHHHENASLDKRDNGLDVNNDNDKSKNNNNNNNKIRNNKFPELLQRAKNIWAEICLIHDNFKTGKEIPADLSMEAFVRRYLTKKHTSSSPSSFSFNNDAVEAAVPVEEEKVDDDGDSDTAVLLSLLEAMYANTAASHNGVYGIWEASREEEEWDYSEHNFRTPHLFADLIQYYLNQVDAINAQGQGLVVISIQTSAPVTHIGSSNNHSNNQDDDTMEKKKIKNTVAKVTLQDQTTHLCDRVVVTVPLAVLKANIIAFEDAFALPTAKQLAITTVNMFSGMKIHVLLRCEVDIPCIPLALQLTELVFCPGECCIQMWFRRNHDSILVTGYVPANARDRLLQAAATTAVSTGTESSSATSDAVQHLVLDQLHRMYRNSLFFPGKTPSCSAFLMHDWSDDEYVRGLYSSPSIGGGWQSTIDRTCRHDLAAPIEDTIFFAGEHTNLSTSASVQAAMESGIRAAEEVWQSLQSSSSS
ncbi:hypothetical protein ACA910_018225 [Epithemia clementina (nom. ined.)]